MYGAGRPIPSGGPKVERCHDVVLVVTAHREPHPGGHWALLSEDHVAEEDICRVAICRLGIPIPERPRVPLYRPEEERLVC